MCLIQMSTILISTPLKMKYLKQLTNMSYLALLLGGFEENDNAMAMYCIRQNQTAAMSDCSYCSFLKSFFRFIVAFM